MSEITDQQHIDFVNSVTKHHQAATEMQARTNEALERLTGVVGNLVNHVDVLVTTVTALQDRVRELEARQ